MGIWGFFNLIHNFGVYVGNAEETLMFIVINSNEVKLMTRDRSLLKRNRDRGYTNASHLLRRSMTDRIMAKLPLFPTPG